MKDLMIRSFSMDMIDECTDLYMQTYAKAPWNESWDSRDTVLTFFKNHMANHYFLGFVAIHNGKIIGVSTGFMKPYIQGMEYYVDDFFVGADYQGQGVGTAFMSAIKNELVSRGIHAIMLNTERDYPAYRFYQNVGFTADENLVILFASF